MYFAVRLKHWPPEGEVVQLWVNNVAVETTTERDGDQVLIGGRKFYPGPPEDQPYDPLPPGEAEVPLHEQEVLRGRLWMRHAGSNDTLMIDIFAEMQARP